MFRATPEWRLLTKRAVHRVPDGHCSVGTCAAGKPAGTRLQLLLEDRSSLCCNVACCLAAPFGQVESVFFNCPNLHFIPCAPVTSTFDNDVYIATRYDFCDPGSCAAC